MKRWLVTFPYHATIFVEVEASTKKAAENKATSLINTSPCVHCAKHIQIDEEDDENERSVYEVNQK